MATLMTTISLTDKMTAPLQKITAAINTTITALEAVDTATNKGFNTAAIDNARKAVEQCNVEITKMKSSTSQAVNAATSATSRMGKGFGSAKLSVKGLLTTIGGLSVVKSVSSLVTNQLDSAFKRMDTMTNYDRTMTAITGSNEKAKASLNTVKDAVTGTAYGLDTAAQAVQNFTTRGMDIGSATSEVTKWLDAVSFYGPGTNEALGTVTDALGKMMSKGTVEMEQLNRLTDVGINAVGIYAQATGKSTSDVQSALSKGEISSQNFITTVSTAFEEGTNGVLKIAGSAKGAATTWSATFDNMRAAITRGLQNLITEVDTAAESVFGKDLKNLVADFGNDVETILGNIGNIVGNVITKLSPIIQTVMGWIRKIGDNFESIVPLFVAGLTIFGLYKGAIATINGLTAIHSAVTTIQASIQAWHNKETQANIRNMIKGAGATATDAAAKTADAAATEAATGAQLSLNTAMLACPALIIVGAFLLIIAVIIACIAKFNKFKTETTTGIENLVGSIFVFGAGVLNFFIGILNGIIQLLYTLLVQPVEDIMNIVYNIFTGGFNSLQDSFTNFLAKCIGQLINFAEAFTKIWDAITGENVTAKLEGARSTVDKIGTNKYYEKKFDFSALNHKIGRRNYKNAYNYGASLVAKVKTKDDIKGNDDLLNELSKITDNTSSAADNTAKISDSVATTSDNIELIKDMAEEQIINRYTSNVNVEMVNHNNINSDLDINDVTEHLRSSIENDLNSNSGGNH